MDDSNATLDPERKAEVQPGLHYSSIRHIAGLGPPPIPQKRDSDWGVQTGFEIPKQIEKHEISIEKLDKHISQAGTKLAPSIDTLRQQLVEKSRLAHAADVARRRACPKRKAVEEEIRKRAEDS